MKSTPIYGAVIALSMCAHGMVEAVSTTQPSHLAQLDRRIGPPNVRVYRAIRDSSEWKNPHLTIRRDGIEVTGRGIASGQLIVSSTELERTLIELPVTAWPYGKVVVIAEIGIRAPDGADDAPIAANLDATRAILDALGVTMERWPG